ncbi:hypothetical protein BU23DRAFT_602125 [Bimuria novae-zelandiae CBS 107.79]|uniref:Uncharacterized protein n=1 Tax=Bimuria novae-zelandiae CBS 107.79 TaxID=1447943 RepID=A0A6A5V077_9PLEO|nr:hypothetical protein BU23DRAFT_602125 [Bimuria novae-zelandiae CBS 107.79]
MNSPQPTTSACEGDCDEDELYSEDFPDLRPSGLRTSGNRATGEGAGHSSSPSPPAAPQPSSPPLVRSEERLGMEEKKRKNAQQAQENRNALEKLISGREQHFRTTAICILRPGDQSPRFLGPVSIQDLLQLALHPDLLLRYFQNERRVGRALQYMTLQIRRLPGAAGGERSHYERHQDLRREILDNQRQDYERVVRVLFEYIEKRLIASVKPDGVVDLTDDEPLTVLDGHLIDRIINRNPELQRAFQELEALERNVHGHRFQGTIRWTGYRDLDEEFEGGDYKLLLPKSGADKENCDPRDFGNKDDFEEMPDLVEDDDLVHPEQKWEFS